MWLGDCLGYCKSPGRTVEGLESFQWKGRGGLLESFCTFPKSESSLLKLNQIQFTKKKRKMLLTNTNLF